MAQDVHGRGTFGGGGRQTWVGVEAARLAGCSAAVFAPGWALENADPPSSYWERNIDLWWGCPQENGILQAHCGPPTYSSSKPLFEWIGGDSPIPRAAGDTLFRSNWCVGAGHSFWLRGQVVEAVIIFFPFFLFPLLLVSWGNPKESGTPPPAPLIFSLLTPTYHSVCSRVPKRNSGGQFWAWQSPNHLSQEFAFLFFLRFVLLPGRKLRCVDGSFPGTGNSGLSMGS